jgi:hypothetical protein
LSPHKTTKLQPPTPPTNTAILRRSPTVEDIEAAELDVELPPESDAQLALTERAAEVRHHFASLKIIDSSSMAVATPSHNFSRQTLEFSLANIRRIGQVPWASIQNGTHAATRTRGLVRPDPSSSFYFLGLRNIMSSSDLRHPVVTQASVIVDAVSLTLLRGSTVDFATELIAAHSVLLIIRRLLVPAVDVASAGRRRPNHLLFWFIPTALI